MRVAWLLPPSFGTSSQRCPRKNHRRRRSPPRDKPPPTASALVGAVTFTFQAHHRGQGSKGLDERSPSAAVSGTVWMESPGRRQRSSVAKGSPPTSTCEEVRLSCLDGTSIPGRPRISGQSSSPGPTAWTPRCALTYMTRVASPASSGACTSGRSNRVVRAAGDRVWLLQLRHPPWGGADPIRGHPRQRLPLAATADQALSRAS